MPTPIRTQYRHPGMGHKRMHGALLGMGALQLIVISKSKKSALSSAGGTQSNTPPWCSTIRPC